MILYSLKRILSSLPTLFLLMTLVFFLLRLAPGGPFDGERVFPPEVQAAIHAHYGLDQPLFSQFTTWMSEAARFDFGESFQYLGREVSEIIGEALPPSLLLGTLGLIFALLVGIPLGILSAWRQGTWVDRGAMLLAISGVSLPSYLVASLLVIGLSLHLGLLPPALWEGPSSMVLPVLTLSLRPLAIIARLVRASMIEVLSSDYIRTAHAKGLSTRSVLIKHALKNTLIPVLTVLGPIAASLVTGSFLVEVVFQIPGLGKHFVGAVLNRDYPLVMGVTLIYGVFLILSNLAVDLLCAWADPRIRLEDETA
jgi:oligopeptide transport system permease protein